MNQIAEQIQQAIGAASELGVIGQSFQESGESVIQGEIMERYAVAIEEALTEAFMALQNQRDNRYSCHVRDIREDSTGGWIEVDVPAELMERVHRESELRGDAPAVTLGWLLEVGASRLA